MKKALIALLSLAVVGAVFAQDVPSLKFSGSLQTGLIYAFGDSTDPAVVWNWADDAGKDAYRLRLGGEYVNGDTSVKFRLSSATASDVAVDFAFASVKLMDAMVLVQSGYKIDDNSWRTTGDGEFDFDVSGLKVQVKPLEGLNLGFAFGAPNTEATAVEPEDATYVLGLAYVGAGFAFQGGYQYYTPGFAPAVDPTSDLYAGFTYTAIADLKLALEAKIVGAAEYADTGRTTVVQTVIYTMSPIEVGLIAREFLYGANVVDAFAQEPDLGYKIKGYGNYTTGIYTLGLEVVYNTDETDQIDDGAVYGGEFSSLSVKPTITAQFNDKSKLVAGYEYVVLTDYVADNAQKLFLNFRYDF